MIPHWANRAVYTHFDAFLQKCILGNDSYITDNPGIFTAANLNACVTAFVDNPDTGDRNFDAKSRDQFAAYPKEVQEVFAHFIWLWGMPASDMTSAGKKGTVVRFLGDDYNEKLTDVFVDGGIGSAGQRHKLNKPFEISYLLLLFREIKSNLQARQITDVPALKKYIETLCRELY